MNLFTTDYAKQEINFLAIPEEPILKGDATLFYREDVFGRLDDYINVQFLAEPMRVPTYGEGKKLWMSMTPMEVQSAHVAIQRASWREKIAIGGLGLGYVPLRIANNADQECSDSTIDVYEKSQDCIDIFLAAHGDRPEVERINIIQGDVREALCGKNYDYCYMDIYSDLLSDNIASDIEIFLSNNNIEEYRYWGQELVLYFAAKMDSDIITGLREDDIFTFDDTCFFRAWMASESGQLRDRSAPGDDWITEVIETHKHFASKS